MKFFLSVAFFLLAIGVILGAFGAHGLKDYFIGREEEIWKTAVFYHLIHSLGLLAVVLLEKIHLLTLKVANLAASFLLFGIVIFSGTLYLLVFTRQSWLGAVTPVGGSLLIAAWLLLAWSSFRRS